MILSKETRMECGLATREDVLGEELSAQTATEEWEKRWEAVREEGNLLLGAEQLSIVLADTAKRLLKDEDIQLGWKKGLLMLALEKMEAYGEAHPFNHPHLDDPLQGLKGTVETVYQLANTTKRAFRRTPKQARINALKALGHWHPPCDEREAFEHYLGNAFKEKRRELLMNLAERCHKYQAVARGRFDALYERYRLQAEAEARVLKAKGQMAGIYGDPKTQEKLLQAAEELLSKCSNLEVGMQQTNELMSTMIAAHENLEKKVEENGERASDAATASLETLKAVNQLDADVNNQEDVKTKDSCLVAAFNIANQALQDNEDVNLSERDIIVGGGILENIHSKKLIPQTLSNDAFIKLFHGWRVLGCSNAAAYVKIHTALGRRPDATAAREYLKKHKTSP